MGKYKKVFETKEDNDKLNKAIKNFNAKLDRITKKNPTAIDFLPQRKKAKELKKNILNRHDLNRTIKQLKAFSEKNAEKLITTDSGITMTLYEMNLGNELVKKVNKKRRNQRKNLNKNIIKINGEELPGVQALTQKMHYKDFKINSDNIHNLNSWQSFIKSAEYTLSNKYDSDRFGRATQHWFKAIDTVFDKKQSNELKRLFLKIGIKKISEEYYSGELLASIDGIYRPGDVDDKYLDFYYYLKELAGEL